MDEVRRFAANSHQVALEAIDKYNTHIELCNRAIEAEERGTRRLPWPEVRKILSRKRTRPRRGRRSELQKRDKTRLESEASHTKSAATPDRSNRRRFPQQPRGGATDRATSHLYPRQPSYADLVRQINILQQQLIAEQDKNKRLKGGA